MADRWNHFGCFTLYSFQFLIVKWVRGSHNYDIVIFNNWANKGFIQLYHKSESLQSNEVIMLSKNR